jgi:TatD DNase family protein
MNKNMLLVDVHAHLDIESYAEFGGIKSVLDECLNNGVKAIVANSVDIQSNRKTLEYSDENKIVKAALGIYPTHCLELVESGKSNLFDEELKFIEKHVKNKKCVAIGEVGLEYKEIKDISEIQKNIQKDCLVKFVNIAKKHDIPVIIHSRGAESDVIELLESEGMKNRKVIMHCFSGRKHLVQKIRDNGWYFSIPCNVERSLHFQQIVIDTPVEKLLTETDSPYMSPVTGKPNRPDNVIYTITKIAELKEMNAIEVSNIVYSNYQKLFT